MKFSQIINFEKSNMNKIRFIMNYRIVPAYLIAVIICIIIISVMMSIDEIKYTPVAIALFVLIGIFTVLLLSSVPYVRKKEVAEEMRRYDFEKFEKKLNKIYDFSNGDLSIHFDSNGMTTNEMFFWYNHLKIRINTSNYLNRVLITIVFFINEENYCEIPFNGDTINMIKKFNVKLENPDVLEYIINHKEDAFNKIYKTGHV